MKIIMTIEVILTAIVFSVVVLAGCAAPCRYQGKAVPRQDAERMRSLGMDIICP